MRECGELYIAWFTKYAAIQYHSMALWLMNKVCTKSVLVHQLLSFKLYF